MLSSPSSQSPSLSLFPLFAFSRTHARPSTLAQTHSPTHPPTHRPLQTNEGDAERASESQVRKAEGHAWRLALLCASLSASRCPLLSLCPACAAACVCASVSTCRTCGPHMGGAARGHSHGQESESTCWACPVSIVNATVYACEVSCPRALKPSLCPRTHARTHTGLQTRSPSQHTTRNRMIGTTSGAAPRRAHDPLLHLRCAARVSSVCACPWRPHLHLDGAVSHSARLHQPADEAGTKTDAQDVKRVAEHVLHRFAFVYMINATHTANARHVPNGSQGASVPLASERET